MPGMLAVTRIVLLIVLVNLIHAFYNCRQSQYIKTRYLFSKFDNNKRVKPNGSNNKKRTPSQRSRASSPSYNTKIQPLKPIDPYSEEDSLDMTKSSRKFIASKQSILGKNLITCRSFSLDSPKTFNFEGSYSNVEEIPTFSIPEIAFIGRSNVGKSSLLNMLSGLNKDIAVVSKTPGRTRLINMFKCKDKEGDICLFVDLPGLTCNVEFIFDSDGSVDYV